MLLSTLIFLSPDIRADDGSEAPAESSLEMVVQQGHGKKINQIAYDREHGYFATASEDMSVRLWNSQGLLVRVFHHTSEVVDLDLAIEQTAMVTVTEDGYIHFWDLMGKELWSWHHEKEYGMSFGAEFSPDGRKIVVACLTWPVLIDIEGTVLWGDEYGNLHDGAIKEIVYSPSGEIIVTAANDGAYMVWNSSGNLLRKVDAHQNAVTCIDTHPEGELFVTGSEDGEVKLWDGSGNTGRLLTDWETEVTSVSFSHDGMLVAASNKNAEYTVWDVNGEVHISRKIRGDTEIHDIVLLQDENFILAHGNEWIRGSLTGRNYTKKQWQPEKFSDVAVSPDGKCVVVGTAEGDYGSAVSGVYLKNATGAPLRPLVSDSGQISEVFFHPSGSLVAGVDSYGAQVRDISGTEKGYIFLGKLGRIFADNQSEKLIITDYSGLSFYDLHTKRSEPWRSYPEVGPDDYLSCVDVRGCAAVFGCFSGKVYFEGEEDGRAVFDTNWSDESHRREGISDVAILPGKERIIAVSDNGIIGIWKTDGTLIRRLEAYSRESLNDYISFYLTGFERFTKPDDGTFDPAPWESAMFRYSSENENCLAIAQEGKQFLTGGWDGTVRQWDSEGNLLRSYRIHRSPVKSVAFFPDEKRAVSVAEDGKMVLYNLKSGEYAVLLSDGNGWVLFSKEGYFDASRNAGYLVCMVKGLECWNIDQFAAHNNRPDIILEQIGYPDDGRIEYYRSLYKKRLLKMDIPEENLEDDLYEVPETEILGSERKGKYLNLSMRFEDDAFGLSKYNIYVNDVPVFGTFGKKVGGMSAEVHEQIELTGGENKVEVSCVNKAGAESYRAVLFFSYEEEPQGRLFFIGFGVSRYKDRSLDLYYAHKDVLDLADYFKGLNGQYSDVIIKTFINQHVTRDNIKAAKKTLSETGVDDTVVLFISGHGIHDYDTEATYYFLTHETELPDLSRTAVDFQELEGLLQGIPARKKLFLMDTCGSGELEPGAGLPAGAAAGGKGVRARFPETGYETGVGPGRGVSRQDQEESYAGSPSEEAPRVYLYEQDRYICNDLIRRSGAIVFSSCRGDQLSYESDEYENGLFTEYLLSALQGKGDADADGIVTSEELRDFVREKVIRETESDPLLYRIPQHPTVDRDNIYQRIVFPVRAEKSAGQGRRVERDGVYGDNGDARQRVADRKLIDELYRDDPDPLYIEQLLKEGASVDARDDRGRTPLMIAIIIQHRPLIELFLKNGADTAGMNEDGYTPFMFAVFAGDKRTASLLLESGADIDGADLEGNTALHFSARWWLDIEMMKFLITEGAKLSIRNKEGQTPLIIAAHAQSEEKTEVLLKAGADANRPDNYGRTALMEAAKTGDTELVLLLLKYGADPDILNASGSSALDIARSSGHDEVVSLLQRY